MRKPMRGLAGVSATAMCWRGRSARSHKGPPRRYSSRMTQHLSIIVVGGGDVAARLAEGLGRAAIDAARPDLASAIAEARPDVIVHSVYDDATIVSRPLAALSDEAWREGVNRPLETAILALQAIGLAYPEAPPPIVFVGPSLAFSGGEGLSLLTAAAEGQRALMKAAARQWGKRGFRFTWIALDPIIFAPALADAKLPRSQDPNPPAIGRMPGLEDLADLLALIADPRGRALTGASLMLDGGELMLP